MSARLLAQAQLAEWEEAVTSSRASAASGHDDDLHAVVFVSLALAAKRGGLTVHARQHTPRVDSDACVDGGSVRTHGIALAAWGQEAGNGACSACVTERGR